MATIVGTSGNDLLEGGPANDQISGGAGNDTLKGWGGNDTLNGGTGADWMFGGIGNDVYYVDDTGDVVNEIGPDPVVDGVDVVYASVNHTLNFYVEKLYLTGTGAINGYGNSSDNVITGNSGSNALVGGGGNDTLDGGAGVDAMYGENGDDVYYVDNAGDTVIESLTAQGGKDKVNSSVTFVLGTYVENLTLTGTAAINGTGNGQSNVIEGNGAANTLSGRDGNDTLRGNGGNDKLYGEGGSDVMEGGAGSDVYYVDSAGDTVTEAAGGGTDTVYSPVSWTLGPNVENLSLTGGAATTGTGNGLNNVINGNTAANTLHGMAGNDTLDGAAGNDSMYGGDGNDTYYVYQGGDVVVEASATGGVDVVRSAVSFTLGAHQENLILMGVAGVINGYGNALNNRIDGDSLTNYLSGGAGRDTMYGGAGNDRLNGGLDADSMVGGDGNDVYTVDNIYDQVVETSAGGGTDKVNSSVSWTLRANQEDLSLTGLAAISGTGNELSNAIFGNAAGNHLYGNGGNDRLNGMGGADTMEGGAGDDVYYLDSVADRVVEGFGGGRDNLFSSVAWTLGNDQENLYLTGSAAINGYGNSLNNVVQGNSAANRLEGWIGDDTLNGGAGDDTMDGGPGIDSMTGGNGNDAYYVYEVGDAVVETGDAGGGIDTVYSMIARTLGDYQENLVLIGTGGTSGYGNALNNSLTGNLAGNSLSGRGGDDVLAGYAGNDILIGGAGNDSLTGGLGQDVFRFDSALSSATNVDRIQDFSPADDTMQLDSAVFANLPVGPLAPQAFVKETFIPKENLIPGAIYDPDDRIIYNTVTGALYYDPDGSGRLPRVQFAVLTGSPDTVTSADFVVT